MEKQNWNGCIGTMMNKKYTFNDISLVPSYAYSEREDVDITSTFCDYDMRIPIISSPMNTLTGLGMMRKMREFGAMGAIHRYYKPPYQELLRAGREQGIVAIAPAVKYEVVEKIIEVSPNPIFVLDVAHGHTKRNLEYAKTVVEMGATVISGNIVTKRAIDAYLNIGVRHFRIGVGSGSVCTTRKICGVGIPQASVIQDLHEQFEFTWVDNPRNKVVLISDGGHKTTGDVVKALALGADFVMLGGMLAGTDESIDPSKHSGMASKKALTEYGKKDFLSEGVTKKVEPKGSVIDVLKEIEYAIKQACYYVGARNLKELREAEVIFVTENGYLEGLA